MCLDCLICTDYLIWALTVLYMPIDCLICAVTVLYVPQADAGVAVGVGGHDGHARAPVRPLPPRRRPGTIGTVLNLRTTTSQKCAAVPRRARVQGS